MMQEEEEEEEERGEESTKVEEEEKMPPYDEETQKLIDGKWFVLCTVIMLDSFQKVLKVAHGNWSDNHCNPPATWSLILLLELY